MKRILSLLFLCLTLALGAQAQHEQDFASIFMKQYAEGTGTQCNTISPAMIEKMLNTQEIDTETRETLQHIKSVRMIINKKPDETCKLFQKAEQLFSQNKARYALYAQYEGKKVYVRKKKDLIVELVLLTNPEALLIIDITGTLPESFVKKLINGSKS